MLALLLGTHLAPSDPGADGKAPNYGPWHGSPEVMAEGLGLLILSLPSVIGFFLAMDNSHPRRRWQMAVCGIAMPLAMVGALFLVGSPWVS